LFSGVADGVYIARSPIAFNSALLYLFSMMLNTELADFRKSLALGQAAFGAWLARELGADRPYANTEVSNWETGKRPVPYSVQAAVYRYLWSKSRDT
jgi:hypothetical protein